MTILSDGPLVYIDDDEDDQYLFEQAVREVGLLNPIHSFPNGLAALHYLETTSDKPLLILCDLNMPVLDGLGLQAAIDQSEYLRQKSIPFIFFTTAAHPDIVRQAYKGNLQGFHTKAALYSDLKEQVRLIVHYWQACLHPNSFW